MKGFFSCKTHFRPHIKKQLLVGVFFSVLLLDGVQTYAQTNDPYINWKTLFGPIGSTPSKEELKNRERSGLYVIGLKNNNSATGTTNTTGGFSGLFGTGTPVVPLGGQQTPIPQLPQDAPNTITGIKNIDIYLSLNKDLQYLANPDQFFRVPIKDLEPEQAAEFVYNMIADDSAFSGTSNPNGGRDANALLVRTRYIDVEGKEKTVYTKIPNAKDGGTSQRVVNATTFILDYGRNSAEIVNQSVISTVTFNSGLAKPGSQAKFDFWYCGGKYETDYTWQTINPNLPPVLLPTGATIDGTNAPVEVDDDGRVQKFQGYCGNTAYYKIGETITETLPTTFTQANQQTTDNSDLEAGAERKAESGNIPACGFAGIGEGTFIGCIAQFFYWAIFTPVAFIAGLLGKIFDFFIAFSLSDESYRMQFIETAWQLVRDISNIFFILIMVWTGLIAVFDTKNVSYKTVVPALIINALLINFSLFFTRVVIDTSNIFARLFYNQMTVTIDGSKSTATVKPLSEAIVSAFNPQKVFDGVLTKELVETVPRENDPNQNVNTDAQQWRQDNKDYPWYFIIVTIVATLIMWSVGMMFWKTAFLFVGRVVGFYVAMIFSPIAFLSKGGVPLVGKIPQLNWGSWWGDLFNGAVMAPVFIFFLYIINAFFSINFFQDISDSITIENFTDTVIKILIPLFIVYFLVSKAVSVAKQFSSTVGSIVSDKIQGIGNSVAGFAGGAALGIATGGVALAGRGLASKLLALSAETKASLEAQRAAGGLSGRWASFRLGTDKKITTSSFDARSTGVFKNVQDAFGKGGITFNDPLSEKLGMGTDDTKGGLKAAQKKEKDKLKKQIESISVDPSLTKDQVKAVWDKKSASLIEKEKARLLNDEEALIALQKENGKTDAEIEAMKRAGTLKNSSQALVDAKAKQTIENNYGTVESKSQLTRALRQEFAQTIAEGKTFGQQLSPATIVGGVIGTTGLTYALGGGVLPVVGGIAVDASRQESERRKNAKKYFDDAVKDKKKMPKQERLEEEKKKLEQELEVMDKTMEEISGKLSSTFDKMIQAAKDGDSSLQHLKDRAFGSYDPTKDKNEAFEYELQTLEAELSAQEASAKRYSDEYGIAERSNNTAKMDELRTKQENANVKASRLRHKLKNLDSNNRSRKERELNGKENELDKIKEKEENKDKPKDEKK